MNRNWKITVTPTKTGLRVKTQSRVGDKTAQLLAEYIELLLQRIAVAR